MSNPRNDSQGHLIGGLILIGIGGVFLLDRMNILYINLGDWWPMFMIIPGLVMALDSNRKNKNGAFFLLTFGLLFQIAELDLFRWWRWRNVWPMMMIAIGAWMLYQHLSNRADAQQPAASGSGSTPPQLNP